ncbi:MAG: helical backbone metal receptor [Brumimicrobium sp.]
MQYIDQLGDKVVIPKTPIRLISLVPSQTELLYDLGLEKRVVGITKFCIHPKNWFKTKERIGGTKNVDIEKIKLLNPDLIIGNKEENTKSDIEKLRKIAPVWMSDVNNLSDSLKMIEELGIICDTEIKAKQIIDKIKLQFSQLEPIPIPKSVLYLIWKKPYMAVGNDTFIHTILTDHLGFKNFVGDKTRYPAIDLDKIEGEPEYIFLSTEPFPFKEKHFEEIRSFFPSSKIYLVDGEYFSWYGSRLVNAPRYFKKLLSEL